MHPRIGRWLDASAFGQQAELHLSPATVSSRSAPKDASACAGIGGCSELATAARGRVRSTVALISRSDSEGKRHDGLSMGEGDINNFPTAYSPTVRGGVADTIAHPGAHPPAATATAVRRSALSVILTRVLTERQV